MKILRCGPRTLSTYARRIGKKPYSRSWTTDEILKVAEGR